MGENTTIEWAHHTFNPWMGCTKVSPGCAHCYAERDMDFRYGKVKWGAGNPRVRTSPGNWKQPLRWNREAIVAAVRPRVFCASLADVFDVEVPTEWRRDLLALIQETPQLDWLLLTKRPQNVMWMLDEVTTAGRGGADWLQSRGSHVWIGTTVEDQQRADQRIPCLASIPARVRFLSCEPMVGPVTLDAALPDGPDKARRYIDHVNWVICGGESGPMSRPIHPQWARTLRDQCQAAGVPFLFKQWGEWVPHNQNWAGPVRPGSIEPHQVRWMYDDGSTATVSDGNNPSDLIVNRLGKKRAGRNVDGRTWDEIPA